MFTKVYMLHHALEDLEFDERVNSVHSFFFFLEKKSQSLHQRSDFKGAMPEILKAPIPT